MPNYKVERTHQGMGIDVAESGGDAEEEGNKAVAVVVIGLMSADAG